VVSSISGITDVVENGVCGQIVNDDVHSVASALEGYLRDPERLQAHGERARQIVEKRLSLQQVVLAYERLFNAVRSGGCAADASLF
jgi:glycosyltransferase involved in cell wall biosynthesis